MKPYPGGAGWCRLQVATYDLMPEMNAAGITEVVVKAIEKRDFDVIVMNYANADMVRPSSKMKSDRARGGSS
jgi:2,3-bisphosphoglycerate-independent phosphoglycerate mutase